MKSYLFLLILALVSAEDELVYVMALSRHGATYPEYENLDWNVAPLALTPAGATQHYLLGKALRERYIEHEQFLNHSYHPEEIDIYAANDNRCAASAAAQAFGLYPPGSAPEFPFDPTLAAKSVPPNEHNYDSWVKELKQSPLKYSMSTIPIITNLPELNIDCESCPHLNTIIETNTNETEEYEKHQSLYDELIAAYETPEEVSLDHVALLRDALISGLYEGKYYKSEEKTKELIEKTSDIQLAEDYENYLNLTHEEIRLSHIVSSGFLERLKDTLEDVIDDDEETKLEIYVGTETLLQAVLMDLFDSAEPDQVPFASVLLLEVYHGEKGYYVKVSYNKEISYVSDVSSFIDKLDEVIRSENTIKDFCKGTFKATFFTKYVEKYWNKYHYLLIALGVLGLAVLIAVFVNCCHKKSEEELQLTKQPPI